MSQADTCDVFIFYSATASLRSVLMSQWNDRYPWFFNISSLLSVEVLEIFLNIVFLLRAGFELL